MLDKLGAAFAPKPSSGPHKSRECLPLIHIIRNRLRYALTYREIISILMQCHVLVDGKVRTDETYSAAWVSFPSPRQTRLTTFKKKRKKEETYRLLYETKGSLLSSPNQG